MTPLIPSQLDDAGLTPAEFRVFCRIARRGECAESVPNMAAGCRMHRDSVWQALKELRARGMVTKESRSGATSIHRITLCSEWLSQPSGNEGLPEDKGYPSKAAGGSGNEGLATQRKRRATKEVPYKGSTKGVPAELPSSFSLEARKAWDEWQQHRREIRKPITASSAKRQIALAAEWGEARWIESIHTAVTRGWQGLFEPRNGNGNNHTQRMPPGTAISLDKLIREAEVERDGLQDELNLTFTENRDQKKARFKELSKIISEAKEKRAKLVLGSQPNNTDT